MATVHGEAAKGCGEAAQLFSVMVFAAKFVSATSGAMVSRTWTGWRAGKWEEIADEARVDRGRVEGRGDN